MKQKCLVFIAILGILSGMGCSSENKEETTVDITVIEAYDNLEILQSLSKADAWLVSHRTVVDSVLGIRTPYYDSLLLFYYLDPRVSIDPFSNTLSSKITTLVGACEEVDTIAVNALLAIPEVQAFFPRRSKPYWTTENELYLKRGSAPHEHEYEDRTICYLSFVKPKPLPVKLTREDIETITVRKEESQGLLYDLYQYLSFGTVMKSYDVTIKPNGKGVQKLNGSTTGLGYFVADIRLGKVRYTLSLTNIEVAKSMIIKNKTNAKELEYLEENYGDMADRNL